MKMKHAHVKVNKCSLSQICMSGTDSYEELWKSVGQENNTNGKSIVHFSCSIK